jgi:hypothetical protein
MNNYLKHFSVAVLITALVCIFLSSCSKEKQNKTYEFEGILYTYHSGLPNPTERNVNGKLVMYDKVYGEISFDGIPAVKVERANPSHKVKYIDFFEVDGYGGGSIFENGEVHYSTEIEYFSGKLK